jgi:hypothetical protein
MEKKAAPVGREEGRVYHVMKMRSRYYRIIFILFLLAAHLFNVVPAPVWAGGPPLVAVHLDGAALQFDVPPRFQQGIPMFPLRKIFEEIGYSVTWEAEAKRAVLRRGGRLVVLYPQNPLYSINGVVCRTSSPPFIERGRIMVGIDFLQESAGVTDLVWDEAEGILFLEYRNGRESSKELPPLAEGRQEQPYQLNFVEVHLPPGNSIQVGESFEIAIAAPFVKGIYSYEIRFFYNPQVIAVKEIKNPFYNPQEEFYIERLNNSKGVLEYIQTSLGYLEEIPPRRSLVVMQAVALSQGEIPFREDTLTVRLLDNKASSMPVALEEKTLSILLAP